MDVQNSHFNAAAIAMSKTRMPCVELHAVAYNAVSNKTGTTRFPRAAPQDEDGNDVEGATSSFVLGMSEYRLWT
jgi:hypothetical protein